MRETWHTPLNIGHIATGVFNAFKLSNMAEEIFATCNWKRKPLNLMETFACASMQQALVIAPSHYCLAELPSFFTTIELSLKSPCLFWALVWPSSPCFIPKFECSCKVSKIKYCLMKLGISSQDFKEIFFYKTKFDEQHEQQQWRHVEGSSKSGDETTVQTNLGEKTSLILFFISCILFSSWLLILSLGLSTLSLGVLCA
jgi:hypothetical protein